MMVQLTDLLDEGWNEFTHYRRHNSKDCGKCRKVRDYIKKGQQHEMGRKK